MAPAHYRDSKHYSHKLCQPDNLIVSANKLIFRHFPNCHLLCSYCSWSRLRLPTTHRPLFAVSLYIILIVRPQQNQFVPPIHWVIVLNGKNTQSDSRSVTRVPQVHSFRCLLFKYQLSCPAATPLTVNKTLSCAQKKKKPHEAHGRHNSSDSHRCWRTLSYCCPGWLLLGLLRMVVHKRLTVPGSVN